MGTSGSVPALKGRTLLLICTQMQFYIGTVSYKIVIIAVFHNLKHACMTGDQHESTSIWNLARRSDVLLLW